MTEVLFLSFAVTIQSSKKKMKNTKREAESSTLEPSCYVANVTPSSLRYDMLNIPKSFARANGIESRSGEIIVLMNEKGTSWTLILKRKNSCGTMYITRGWRRFCRANGLKAGCFFTFKLIQRGGTLFLHKSPSSTESEDSSEGDEIEPLSTESKSFKKTSSIWKASSSSFQNLFVTLTLKPYEVEKSTLYLPVQFTRRHSINEETKMTLLDKYGVKWSTDLRSEKRSDKIRLVGGWKEFFKANCVEMGESIIVKLIWDGDTKKIQEKKNPKREEAESSCFVANVRLESDEESNHISSQERIDREDKKGLTSQSRFVTLTIRYWDVKNSRLYLPMAFTKDSGINVKTKLALLDKNDVKWPTDLRSEYNGKRLRMIGGWKKFFKANFLKIGESIKFKLIWDGNTSCVLKLCS
ncbi:hypothetical protein Bca4012_033130 [Brassica carinata]